MLGGLWDDPRELVLPLSETEDAARHSLSMGAPCSVLGPLSHSTKEDNKVTIVGFVTVLMHSSAQETYMSIARNVTALPACAFKCLAFTCSTKQIIAVGALALH